MRNTNELWCVAMILSLCACKGGVINNTADQSPSDIPQDAPPAGELAPSTGIMRLTHAQWENTVQDLFLLDAQLGLSSELRADTKNGHFLFDSYGGLLDVDGVLWSGYRRAAAAAAETLAADASLPERLGLTSNEPSAVSAWLVSFGMRACRRPIDEDTELPQLRAIFENGENYYPDLTPTLAGVRSTVEAVLQLPCFVYRTEGFEFAEQEEAVVALGPFELASRLSYALWNSMPDDQLLQRAQAGELSTEEAVVEEAHRMLEDPRANAVMERFHAQLFDSQSFSNPLVIDSISGTTAEALGRSAEAEFDAFINHVASDPTGNLMMILMSKTTFVDKNLAPLYGLSGSFGDELTQVELDENRAGVLTQIGFLASRGTRVQSDPIHRGVYIGERIACATIPAPPDDIPPFPEAEGQTNRELVESLTESDPASGEPIMPCASCHASVINPFGYPLEYFGAAGQFRAEDNGFPINGASEPLVNPEPVPVDSPAAYASALSESQHIHDCYAKHWLEYLLGRTAAEEDKAYTAPIAQKSLDGGAIKSILVELVSSQPFRFRRVEE